MADIWMDVDTALTEVPVNVMPLIDATDFKTIEDAVAYNATGMALFWHFVTSAGAYTVTAVTPTTAGTYDWTDQGTAGIYTIEIPASGGASINNDTEGYGWFTGRCDGVLPWRGPVIGFRAAAINDALCDGGDLLDVSVTQVGGDAQSATDLKDFADAGYDPATNKVEGVKLADTLTTYTNNTVQTGDSYAIVNSGTNGNAALKTLIDAIAAETAAILVDTSTTVDDLVDDLEGRLTAALATALQAHSLGIGRGVVGVGSDTTHVVFDTVNGAAASAENDFYNGRHIIFTSGAMTLQACSITDYVGGTTTATVSAVTGSAAAAVTFIIV